MDSASLETLLGEDPWMRRLASALVADAAAADDVVQSAWLALLRSRRPVDPARGVRGFLATVLRRQAGSDARSRTRRALRETATAEPAAMPSPADIVAE